jgi:hypothetical protein
MGWLAAEGQSVRPGDKKKVVQLPLRRGQAET